MGVIRKRGVNYSGGFDYSEVEQKTGCKWIDGKDIYVRTYTGVVQASMSRLWVTVDDFTDKTLIGLDDCSTINDGVAIYPIFTKTGRNTGVTVGMNVDLATNHLQIVTQNVRTYTYYLTVLYTKNTE